MKSMFRKGNISGFYSKKKIKDQPLFKKINK